MRPRLKAGESLAVTGVGTVSPVGGTAAETAASVRAGVCRFREASFYKPVTRNPAWDKPEALVASAVPDLPLSVRGAARIFELGARALRDLFRAVSLRRAELARAGLFLALPEPDEVSRGWALGPAVGAALGEHLGLPAVPVLVTRLEGGAGSLAILGDAAEALSADAVDTAIVLGVDTFIDRDRLRHLDAEYRVKSARATAGMIPGEAGVALLIEKRSDGPAKSGATPGRATPGRAGGARLATLAATGLGQEPQLRSAEAESSGAGLSQALRLALEGVAEGGVPGWVICDLNGEPYRAIEWGIVRTRLGRELGGVRRLSHAADCVGEIGAASGGLAVVQAVAGFARGYAPEGDALLWATADGKLRAAARLVRPTV